MSADAIADVVTTNARQHGWDLAPHDLRRTFAKLARSGQAPLEQLVGHSTPTMCAAASHDTLIGSLSASTHVLSQSLAFQLRERRQVSQVTQAKILQEGGCRGEQAVLVQGDQLALQECANGAVAAGAA